MKKRSTMALTCPIDLGVATIADIVIGELLPESALRDIHLWTG